MKTDENLSLHLCPNDFDNDDDPAQVEADLLDEAMDAYYNEWED